MDQGMVTGHSKATCITPKKGAVVEGITSKVGMADTRDIGICPGNWRSRA